MRQPIHLDDDPRSTAGVWRRIAAVQFTQVYWVLIVGLIVGITGCGAVSDQTSAGESRSLSTAGSDSTRLPESWRFGPLLVQIGSANGNTAENLFDVRNAIRRSDGVIAIANGGTKELRFYDATGKHLRSVGREGGGPGEFRDLQWIERWMADTVVAYGYRNGRLSFFGPMGDLGREVAIQPPRGIPYVAVQGLFNDGSLLARTPMKYIGDGSREYLPAYGMRGLERKRVMLLHVPADGEGGDSIGWSYEREVFNGGPSGQTAAHFARHTWFDTWGRRFYIADNETYAVKEYDQRGRLIRIIGRSWQNLAVTEADRDALERKLKRKIGDWSPASQQRATRQYATIPIPETMPAFGHLGRDGFRVDGSGNLWIREYNRPDDEVPRWSVFNQEGDWIARITGPVGFNTTDIGDQYVLGIWQDSLDVEYLRLYELLK